MNPFKIFKVFAEGNALTVTHNSINKELMPELEQYWKSKGSFNNRLYAEFLRIRNTEVIKVEGDKSIQVVYDHSSDAFELRQGFVSMDGSKSDLEEAFTLKYVDLESVYQKAINLKQKQL